MVRVSEKFLQQITLLAKDGSLTVDASTARVVNAANPVDPQDLATKNYVDNFPLAFTLANVLSNGNDTNGENINFTSGSQITSDDYLTINTTARIIDNLFTKGTTVGLYTDDVNIESNYVFLGQNYTTVSAQTGGMVVNYLPTSTTTSVAATGFTAGVAGVSNPTVRTVGSATFAAGELIMISGANKESNDGLYEVLSHSGNLLTIRGIGTAAALQTFTANQFVTDTTVAGTITKVNVSVMRTGTDGVWEVGKGSTNSFTFNDLVTSATGLPPTGAAGGDLISPTPANNYPNPLVKGFTTDTGTGTQLTYGTILSTQLLQRSGTQVSGISISALPISGQVTGTLGTSYVTAAMFGGYPLSLGFIGDGQFLIRSGNNVIGANSSISGPAGGDLDGYYPDPSVVAGTFNSTQLTFGSVADGEFLVRSGGSIIGTASAISGPAGGDLNGTYPDPSVVAGTFNSTQLTFGSVADGEFLVRSGGSIIGATSSISGPAGGDLDGYYPNPSVIAGTFDLDQLAFGPVADGQFLVRSGSAIIGTASSISGPAGGDLDGYYPNPSVIAGTFGGSQNLAFDQTIGDGYILVRQGNSIVGTSPIDISSEVTVLDAVENCTLGGCGSNVNLGGGGTFGEIWGCMILAKAKTIINSMSCLVKQASGGSNTLKMGVYTLNGMLIGKTVWGSCSTSGLKTLEFESPVTLQSGTLYYMACLNMANGALLLGRLSVGEPGTVPIVSWKGPNYSDLPNDISGQITNTNSDRVWVAGRP